MGSIRFARRLSLIGVVLAALTPTLPPGSDGLIALALIVTLGIVVDSALTGILVRVAPPSGAARISVVASRECNRHTAFLRVRDPAAPGRSQPRAPSLLPAAA